MVVPGWYKELLFLLAVSVIAWAGRLLGFWSSLSATGIQLCAVWLVLFDAAAFRQVLEEREKIRKLLKQTRKKP